MILMAVAGAAVLAMVAWAALREAQQSGGPRHVEHRPVDVDQGFSARESGYTARSSVADPRGGHPRASRVPIVGDATLPGADTDEALAAAAALWQVLVDAERG